MLLRHLMAGILFSCLLNPLGLGAQAAPQIKTSDDSFKSESEVGKRALAFPAQKPEPTRTDRYGDPLPNGALQRLGTLRLQQDGVILALAYSPDGKMLVSGGGERSGFRGTGWNPGSYGLIHVWDPLTGKELRRLEGHAKSVRAIAFTGDGKILASAGDDGVVILWDVATGKELRRIRQPGDMTMDLAFSRDDKLIFAASPRPENAILVWDATSGEMKRRLLGPEKGFSDTVIVSPNGKLVAANWNMSSKSSILVWDVGSGRLLHQLSVPESSSSVFLGLSFSPDGKLLASGAHDETIRLWDVDSGQPLHQIPSKCGYRVWFSSDGKVLASTGSSGAILWDPATGRQVRSLPDKIRRPDLVVHGAQLSDRVAFSPDSRTLAWSTDHAIRLLDPSAGKERPSFERHMSPVTSVAISPDGKTIASAGDCLRLWEAATGKEKIAEGNIQRVSCSAFSTDSRTLVGGSSYQTINLWDVDSGKELRQFTGEPGMVEFVAFLPDGRTVASMSRHVVHPIDKKSIQWKTEMQIRIWNIESGKQIRSIGNVQIFGAALAPDGKHLATGSTHWKVHFWDVENGKESGQVAGGVWLVPVLAFSSDGRKIAVAFHGRPSGGIALFERITGEEILRFEGLEGPVGALTVSPKFPLLASGGTDGVVRLWDLDSGKELKQLTGHQGGVLSLAFSSDGERLISGSRDTTVMIWDVRNVMSSALPEAIKPEELRHLSTQLLESAPEASRAVARLAGSGDQVIPFLHDQVLSPSFPNEQQIARMIADLDDDSVAVREKATQELTKLGKHGEPALRRALEAKPSKEVQARIDLLLRRLKNSKPSPDIVRSLRILEVLERIGTNKARELVEAIGQKASEPLEPLVVSEAKATLGRLANRETKSP